VRLAVSEPIGYKESELEIKSQERRRIRESMQKHKEELLKDDRIKPTVVLPMQEDARESHEEGRSPDLQKEEEDSESEESPPPPVVTPETRQAIRTLEIIAAEKAKLDERDERRRIRHEEIQAKIHRPSEKEETVAIITPKRKKKPPVAAKSKAKKSEDGKAKQAKAEQRTKKGKP
jgi:hypothetical protein